jgi:nucleotide-binding universal stress UspA family protein
MRPDGTAARRVDDGFMSFGDPAEPGPIVVGVERSERSRDALALARTLARAAGTRLILVAVYSRDARSASIARSAYTEALADDAEATLEWVARPLAGVRAELRAVPGASVSRGLRQVAAHEGALAIVVGPSHRGSVGRVVPGSVGARLLHGAACPVAIAPRGYSSAAYAPIRQIGVGYVATPEADEALSAAVGLAACIGAAVRVVGVVEPAAGTAEVPFGMGYLEREEWTHAALTHSVRRAIDGASTPVNISGEVVDGYADDELARLSGEVDLLVCGSRGHGPIAGVILGSMSTGLLRKARGPVLIIPRGARDGFASLDAPPEAAASLTPRVLAPRPAGHA